MSLIFFVFQQYLANKSCKGEYAMQALASGEVEGKG